MILEFDDMNVISTSVICLVFRISLTFLLELLVYSRSIGRVY